MSTHTTEQEFVLTRECDAPLEMVWRAWTEAGELAQWWGPKGFEMLVVDLDFRPGGVFHYSMRDPEGRETWGKFVYQEIDEPRRIVFVSSFADAEGNIVRAPMSSTWPLEVMNELVLEEHDGHTKLMLRGGPMHATIEEQKTFAEGRESMQKGFEGTWSQLDAYLAGKA